MVYFMFGSIKRKNTNNETIVFAPGLTIEKMEKLRVKRV
ncbi:hypothetical protein C7448_101193 [Tenacibaculum gallaicum]|uniref:Uncharacterized protein n=1 Tax=Tenacibaculum gallaicum TaxID=561505 RepID=A0A3E0IBP6_9FLAO|nr:hypothetical protein C7448_101193 [Tenacibaculum gallaicum]